MIIKTIRTLGVQSLLNITGCILAFLFLQSIANKLNYGNSKVYKFCEKRSMGVYLYTPPRQSHLHGLREPLCRTLRATFTE